MPGPCSAFQSVNNFGNRFYRKEKRPGCALLFSIESVTKVVNRFKPLHGPGNRLHENQNTSEKYSLHCNGTVYNLGHI